METHYDQFCPIAKASEVFATRWTPLILRELMADIHGFNDIHRGVPLISRAVLTARLRELEDHGIIERRARTDGSGHEYWLTPAGNAFRSVVGALGQWGLVHARDRIKPSDLDPSILMWGFFASAPIATRCRIGALSCASSSPMCRQRAPSSGSCGSFSSARVSMYARRIRALPSTW